MDYILYCTNPLKLTSKFKEDLQKTLLKLNAQNLETKELSFNGFAYQYEFHSSLEKKIISEEIKKTCQASETDHYLEEKKDYHAQKKIIAFDMDSTFIQQEVIDEMAKILGFGDKVKKITERAMNGEINFNEALMERVKLLEGMSRSEFDNIYSRLSLSPGAMRVISEAKNKGIKIALVSGGFKYFAEKLRENLKLDYAFANELEWSEGILTGRTVGEIINGEKKAEILNFLCIKEDISMNEILAVGDGANDIPMLTLAGTGIAYHGKKKVTDVVSHQINYGPLSTLLYFLGIPGDHFCEDL